MTNSFVFLDTTEVDMHELDLRSHVRRFWPAGDIDGHADSGADRVVCQVDGVMFAIRHLPTPYPWAELGPLVDKNEIWDGAREQLRHHPSHVLITLLEDISPLDGFARLTAVTAGFLAACDAATGVLWENSETLVPAPLFRELAAKKSDIQPFWFRVHVGLENGCIGGYTKGLAELGQMEFEVLESPESFRALHERLLSLAVYVLELGGEIRDGDSVGADATERIRVTYQDSHYGSEGKVMRLDYEQKSPEKPW